MRKANHILLIPFILLIVTASAQVRTDFNNNIPINEQGRYGKHYKTGVDFEVPAKDIGQLLEIEKESRAKSSLEKPFQLAVPVAVDLDLVQMINWINDGQFAFGKFTIKLNGALSASINFDRFFLPKGTEMYVYNENGNMITGPVTESENNANNIWGSWVYKGPLLTIEIKTPLDTKDELRLHAGNVAYGYKEIYRTQVADFGTSASCHVNVVCPLGNGWEKERNAVALILADNGLSLCSGAMVMNSCNSPRPYFLTANHCFTTSPQQNEAAWRFIFQAWSSTCDPSQNSDGIMFNGSTLRARSSATDFCLVELNNTPAATSGIHYAGWSRSTTNITQTTIIHHPRGDVMKITRDNQTPSTSNFLGADCWFLVTDEGTTEGGSSGSPYFDQNHRIIGQHYGINDNYLPVCQQVNKFGGRFDLSWTGGGTPATRLSDWLDPENTNAMTTNTTDVSLLPSTIPIGNVIGYFTTNPQPTTGGTGSSQTPLANNTYQSFYVPRSSYVSINFVITTPTHNSYKWSESSTTWTGTGLSYSSSIQASAYGYSSTTKTIYLDASTNCDTKRTAYTFNVVSLGWRLAISASPNPTKDNLNIAVSAIDEKTGEVLNGKSYQKPSFTTNETIFTLYETNTNRLVRQWKFAETDNTNYKINVKGLKSGLYVVKMDRDGQSASTKIVVQ